MAKLSNLIEGIAAALQVAPTRGRTAAAALRKAKMITSGPRGPGAPEMTPTDATNLLLALMYDEELANSPESVSRLRQAEFQGSRKHVRGRYPESSRDVPPHHFVQDHGVPHRLGAVLDTMIDWYVRGGTLDEEPCTHEEEGIEGRYASNISLSVSRPGHHCKLHIDAFDIIWDIDYRWKSQAELDHDKQRPQDGSIDFRPRFDTLNGPYMTSTRFIGEGEFSAIADALRGEPFDEDRVGLYVPSYDAYPEWHYGDDRQPGTSPEEKGPPL